MNLRIVVVSVLLFSVRLDLAGRLLAVQHAQPCCIMLVTQLAIAVGACARMGGPRVRPRGCPQAWGACFRSVDVVHYVRGGPQSLCPARARGACATRPRGAFLGGGGQLLAAGNSWDLIQFSDIDASQSVLVRSRSRTITVLYRHPRTLTYF